MTAPYTFTLPRTFQPSAFLSGRLALRADDARWLMSTILRKTASRDTDPWGCVRLHSTILRRVMDSHAASDVIQSLVGGGALEAYGYCPGVKAKGFRLAQRYLGDRCVRVPCVDPRLRERIEREQQRLDAEQRRAVWLPIHHVLDMEQRGLSIDTAADVILDGLPDDTRLCQDVLVSRLRHREFPFIVSTTGRVFNALTGLKRELRAALRIGGEPVGGVDVSCSQPALLSLEMALRFPPNGPKCRSTYRDTPATSLPCPSPPLPVSDPDGFGPIVRDGGLYEALMAHTGLDRARVKVAVMRDVLAKKGNYPSVVEDAFRALFPSVYAFIRRTNLDDHAALIRRLQERESWLVVEQVAPLLVGRVPTITLHDAIYSRRSALDVIEQAFEAVFQSLGFRLTTKREGA